MWALLKPRVPAQISDARPLEPNNRPRSAIDISRAAMSSRRTASGVTSAIGSRVFIPLDERGQEFEHFAFRRRAARQIDQCLHAFKCALVCRLGVDNFGASFNEQCTVFCGCGHFQGSSSYLLWVRTTIARKRRAPHCCGALWMFLAWCEITSCRSRPCRRACRRRPERLSSVPVCRRSAFRW